MRFNFCNAERPFLARQAQSQMTHTLNDLQHEPMPSSKNLLLSGNNSAQADADG